MKKLLPTFFCFNDNNSILLRGERERYSNKQ